MVSLCPRPGSCPLGGFAVFIEKPAGDGKQVRILDLPEGHSLKKFAGDLEQTGIISSARLFTLYARIRGADARVKAGSYQVNDGLSPAEILRKLVKGDVFAYRFTVPEGYSIYQIAELLEGRGLFKKTGISRTVLQQRTAQGTGHQRQKRRRLPLPIHLYYPPPDG